MSETLTDAELIAAYEAGAGLRALGKRTGTTAAKIRARLVSLNVEIRAPPHGCVDVVHTASAERDARVVAVTGFLLRGLDKYAILKHVNEALGWNVRINAVERYMTDARAAVTAYYAEAREHEAAMADARDDHLYSRSLANDDLKTCVQINTERNKRHGLYPAARTEITGKDGGEIVLYLPDNGRLQRPAE